MKCMFQIVRGGLKRVNSLDYYGITIRPNDVVVSKGGMISNVALYSLQIQPY